MKRIGSVTNGLLLGLLATWSCGATSLCAQAPVAPCDEIDLNMEVESIVVDASASEFRIDIAITGVETEFPVNWAAGVAWDRDKVELREFELPEGIEVFSFNNLTLWPEYGQAGIWYREDFAASPDVYVPVDGRAVLGTLVFDVIVPEDCQVAVVQRAPTAEFEDEWFLVTHIDYCDELRNFSEEDGADFVPGDVHFGPMFRRGDLDFDGDIEINDVVTGLRFLFAGDVEGVTCLDAADTDDNGQVDLSDCVLVFNHLFRQGPPPSPPFEALGGDPTTDELPACETP